MRTALRIAVAVGTLLAMALPAAGIVAAAGVSMSPSSGAIGTPVTVSGSGFNANATVQVFFNGSGGPLVAAEASDGSGNLNNLTFTIPNFPAGTYQIFASDGSNNATTNFSIGSSLTLSPSSGNVGTGVNVSGTGFFVGENVVVGWDSAGNQVATATANGNGAFSVNFSAPSSGTGNHTVFATGQSSGLQLSSTFNVTANANAQSTACNSNNDDRPGNGFGDRNHCHTGPPGHQGDQGDQDNHGDHGDHGGGNHGRHGGKDQGEDD